MYGNCLSYLATGTVLHVYTVGWLSGCLTEWLVDGSVGHSVGRLFVRSLTLSTRLQISHSHTRYRWMSQQNMGKQCLLILNNFLFLIVPYWTICVWMHTCLLTLMNIRLLYFFYVTVVVDIDVVVVVAVAHLSSYIFVCRILQFQCLAIAWMLLTV